MGKREGSVEGVEMSRESTPFRDFYLGKRVLVTGHTGFKGSWLTLWLLQLGAEVAGLSAYLPSDPCNFEVLDLETHVRHHVGDIRDFDQVRQVFDDFQPHVVFHLAAQAIVRRSYDDPKLTFDTNVGGTVNVLECIRQHDFVEAGVIITSDKCYRNREWVWGYRENDPFGGDDPYSASKGCAEIVINSYCESFFNGEKGPRIASTRAGNVIGGGDWAEDRIVPDCVRAWSEGGEVIVRNPLSTRPWQHVLEPLSGYLWLGVLLGQNEVTTGNAFNFGPKTEVIQPVETLVKAFRKFWDKAQWKIGGEESSKQQSRLLKLCCDKALFMLNWEAVLSFDETIEFTALWYRHFYEKREDMFEIGTQQIRKYCSLANAKGMQWAGV
jgi:CDP-glucose 4,6-dehydratase